MCPEERNISCDRSNSTCSGLTLLGANLLHRNGGVTPVTLESAARLADPEKGVVRLGALIGSQLTLFAFLDGEAKRPAEGRHVV